MSRNVPAVLVVENDIALRDGFEIALAYAGYHVMTAQDGEVALERIRTHVPDLIILDILMPVMDGREFLRQFDNKDSIPIVALSNLDSKADIDEIVSLGAHECHLKSSITPLELINLVKTHVK